MDLPREHGELTRENVKLSTPRSCNTFNYLLGLMPTDNATLYLSEDILDYEMIRQSTRVSDPSKGVRAILYPDLESVNRSQRFPSSHFYVIGVLSMASRSVDCHCQTHAADYK